MLNKGVKLKVVIIRFLDPDTKTREGCLLQFTHTDDSDAPGLLIFQSTVEVSQRQGQTDDSQAGTQ